jgi:hypothetical protein
MLKIVFIFNINSLRLLTATDYVKNSIYFLQNQFKNIVIQYFGGDPYHLLKFLPTIQIWRYASS